MEMQIPDGHYGASTEAIRRIIRLVENKVGHFEADPRSKSVVERLSIEHLLKLQNVGLVLPEAAEIRFLEGDWQLLHQDLRGDDPYEPWGLRWKEPQSTIGDLCRVMFKQIESDENARSLLLPPLWPFTGRANVCGLTFVMTGGNAIMLKYVKTIQYKSRDWTTAWGLVCQCESHIWDALAWEICPGFRELPNPFLPLVEIYALGYYPLGFEEGYCVFSYIP